MRMQGRRSFVPCCVLAAVLLGGTAWAQQPAGPQSPDDKAALEAFKAARELFEKGDCLGAIPKFRESIKRKPGVGARLNLAECFEKTGAPAADSWNQYRVAELLALDTRDDRLNLAHDAAAKLDSKVVRVTLSNLPPNAKVVLNGRDVDESDVKLLSSGYAIEAAKPNTFEVTVPGKIAWKKTIEPQAAGKVLEPIPVVLEDEKSPTPPGPAEDPNLGNGQRTLGLVAGGVGIAGIAVGSIFGLVAIGKKNDVKTACQQGGGSYPSTCGAPQGSQDNDNSAAKSNATISTIGFVAGGIFLVGGTVLYFTAPRAKSASAAQIHLAPSVAPGYEGVALGGKF
jgi:hypothetical protein